MKKGPLFENSRDRYLVARFVSRFIERYRHKPERRCLERRRFIRAIQVLLDCGQCLALRWVSSLVEVDCRVESVLLLIYQIPDVYSVQAVQWNIPVVAFLDVNKIRCLTRSVGGGAILLTRASVSDTLTLENGSAFKVEILDRWNGKHQSERKEADNYKAEAQG